jgi:hypothetical protein
MGRSRVVAGADEGALAALLLRLLRRRLLLLLLLWWLLWDRASGGAIGAGARRRPIWRGAILWRAPIRPRLHGRCAPLPCRMHQTKTLLHMRAAAAPAAPQPQVFLRTAEPIDLHATRPT